MIADRYTKAMLTIIAALLGVLAWVAVEDRPVKLAEFSAIQDAGGVEQRRQALAKLRARQHAIYVQDGLITVDQVQETVRTEIESGSVTVDGEVSVAPR